MKSEKSFPKEREAVQVEVPLTARVSLRRPEPVQSANRVYLLMHGYEQDGEGLLRRLEAALPRQSLVLSPDAPFPLPRKVERRYRVGFSWYFYDPYQDEYFVGPQSGVAFLRGLLVKYNPERLPVTLIGFSQGGYLAPFLAQEVPEVDHLIGIGCQFLEDEFDYGMLAQRSCRMDAIHGAQDEVVSGELARASHEALVRGGISGRFVLLEGTGHRIDDAVRAQVRDWL